MPSTLKIFRNTDSGAPALTGEAGKLAAAASGLLYGCLVSGYGSNDPAGWTEAYNGTNKAAYKQGGGGEFYMRVQDDGPGAASYQEARVKGYETMSDVDTGTNLFPTAAQKANGLFFRKSASLDATERAWRLFADTKCCYLFVQSGDYSGKSTALIFGDVVSSKAGDTYLTHIIAQDTENTGANTANAWESLHGYGFAALTGHYCVRTSALTAGAAATSKFSPVPSQFAGATAFKGGGVGVTYPMWDGGALVDRVYLWESANVVRGFFPGLWVPAHNNPLADGAQIGPIDIGDGVSRTFEAVSGIQGGQFLVEVSDTWYS